MANVAHLRAAPKEPRAGTTPRSRAECLLEQLAELPAREVLAAFARLAAPLSAPAEPAPAADVTQHTASVGKRRFLEAFNRGEMQGARVGKLVVVSAGAYSRWLASKQPAPRARREPAEPQSTGAEPDGLNALLAQNRGRGRRTAGGAR